MHSWRALVLPFRESQELLDRIDLNARWDAAKHESLHIPCPHGMQCHSREDGSGDTHYFAVTAPNSIWQDRELRLEDIKDDASKTLLLIELDLPGINWMSPVDVTLDELLAMLRDRGRLPGPHPRGLLVAFADGHVETVPHDVITPELLQAWVSIDGGEAISDRD